MSTMSGLDQKMQMLQYTAVPAASRHSAANVDVFSTNADPMHGRDSIAAAITGENGLSHHSRFFGGLAAATTTAVAVLEEEASDEDDASDANDVLLRLLNEVRAVDSDSGSDEGAIEQRPDRSAGLLFSVTEGATTGSGNGGGAPKAFAVPYSGLVHAGGFTVEGNASYSSTTSMPLPPPPPPPPPAYGTPSTAPRSPYTGIYGGIPHPATTPVTGMKLPPPSFAQAMATAHGTPASLAGVGVGGSRPSPSLERSPVMTNYALPTSAVPPEAVLLRNGNGVFLLQPIAKPTPPYTPAAGSGTSPPVSPLPRYSLPPAAGLAAANSSTASNSNTNNFLGNSMAQAGGRPVEPPVYATYAPAGGSPFLGTAAPFLPAVSVARGTPSFAAAAPPPYLGGL